MPTNTLIYPSRVHTRLLRQPGLTLQRRCLLERHFSSTPSLAGYRKSGRITDSALTKAAAGQTSGPAPKVNLQMASQNMDAMQEDIGLLQGTIVRAPLKKLPSPFNRQFWSYFWNLLKAKGTGFYSRSHYQGCIQKTRWTRFLPVDIGNNAQLKDRAKKLYVQIYDGFARNDISPLKSICLPPLTKQFQARIAARGALKMNWKLTDWTSVRVVSHRASAQNEDMFADTAYRQAIVRLESVQKLEIDAPAMGSKQALRWVRDKTRTKGGRDETAGTQFMDNGKPQTVVEYLVLQRRVVRGKEEEWKVWGFTEQSTPMSIEQDEAYWRKALDANLAS